MTKAHITIADVAEKANVSKMTVSRVINNKGEISEETRQKIVRVMEELGYRPNRVARSLATSKTMRIGIMVPSIANPYFGAIIEGAEKVFWDNDYHILLGHTGSSPEYEADVMEMFEDNRVDGVLVLSPHSSKDAMNRYLRGQRAAVAINTPVNAEFARRIYTDEIKSMSLAVNHLLKAGRHRLGYVRLDINTYAHNKRSEGFELALRNAGLDSDPDQQITTLLDHTPDMMGSVSHMLQANPHMDGLVCFTSGIAAVALKACARLGRRVPEDIAIIGYDDISLAELITPSLTTLDLTLPKEEVGAMAARMLLEEIADSNMKRDDVILEHKLIIRDSAP